MTISNYSKATKPSVHMSVHVNPLFRQLQPFALHSVLQPHALNSIRANGAGKLSINIGVILFSTISQPKFKNDDKFILIQQHVSKLK